MQKKLLASAAISTAMLLSSVSVNAGSVSANATLTSDYVWRGVSQTDESPAIQAGLDWSGDSGVYVGTWASNVDFGTGTESDVEIDLYAGWATELDSGLGIDLGIIQYFYTPNDDDLEFNEIYVGLSHSGFSGKVSYDVSNENTYLELGHEAELSNDFSLGFHIGNYIFDGGLGYTDFSLALNKSYSNFDFGLAYHDTKNLDTDQADGRVVFSISTSF